MKQKDLMIVMIFFLTGCATLPSTAPTAPEAGISISIDFFDKSDIFSVFLCPMNDRLWAQEAEFLGQSPAFGKTKDGEVVGKVVEGIWFRLGIEKRGLTLILVIFPGKFSRGNFIYLSRDGLEAFSPTGEIIQNFDGQRFGSGKDKDYQTQILSTVGTDEEKLILFWREYYDFHRDLPPEGFSPVSFLTKKEIKEFLENFFEHKYQMPNGEVFSNLPPEKFKEGAIQNTAITTGDKFLKNFRIGIPLDPLSAGLMGGAAVVNGIIGATSERYPSGYYGSALIQRREMGPTFEKLIQKYRQLLLERAEWERKFLAELCKEGVDKEKIRQILMRIGLP